jgi:nicotinamide riboside kinase
MTRLLVTTGAESSGKTTLARQLSAALSAPLVLEASRDYLTALYARHPAYRYNESDLLHIAQLQRTREQEALRGNEPFVVCDTDTLVIIIWSEVVFGRCAPELRKLFDDALTQTPRHYLLCDWNGIAWEPDPLRENPHDRDKLFARYRDKLDALGLDYRIISGTKDERLQQAIDAATPG